MAALNVKSERHHARRSHQQRSAGPKPHQSPGTARSSVLGRQIRRIEGAAVRSGEECRALRRRRGERTQEIGLGMLLATERSSKVLAHSISFSTRQNASLIPGYDTGAMRKSLIIAIIACLMSTSVNAKSYTRGSARAQPRTQIACTVLGCAPVPPGCVPRPGYTWSGLPSGFDVI